MDDVINLGEKLKELRLERNLTQKELADKFNINSVTYLHYEKNQRRPSLELLVAFTDFFDVSLDYLLSRED